MRVSPFFASLLCAGVLFGAGCGDKKDGNGDGPKTAPTAEDDWTNNPGDYTDALYAVGVAPMKSRLAEQNARSASYTNGQQQLAAALKAKIQSLGSTWSKSTGDASDEATIQELFNNEQFTRQIVDNTLAGARAVRYKIPTNPPGNAYCLVALDGEKYTKNVREAAGDALKKLRTEAMTDVRKAEAEKKLDELLDKEEKRIQQTEDAVLKARGIQAKKP